MAPCATAVIALVLGGAAGYSPGVPRVSATAARNTVPRMQLFKTPKSTDPMSEQMSRLETSGMSPAEYEEATRCAANDYLRANGLHASSDEVTAGSPQRADFLKQLWNVDEVPSLPASAAQDPARVVATIYEIGGPLTGVLSTSVAKKLPLIPHVGIRVHGVEYFYSDHIECRTVKVMEEMLGDRPQVSLDLGPARLSAEEVEAEVARLEAQWSADDYHVFDKNCVHFGVELAKRTCEREEALPEPLVQGVLDVSERMLDSLPEWRRALGRRVMNEVTRLVVVSWGRASQAKKEETADKLGLERGA